MAKILYVINSLDRGGAETHLLRVLPTLRDEGIDAEILVLKKYGHLKKDFEALGFQIHGPSCVFPLGGKFSRKIWYIWRAIEIYWHLLCKRPRVIHFILPESYLTVGLISLLTFIPVKVMSRRSLNLYQKQYPPFFSRVERFLHQRMDALIGNSQRVVDQLVHEEGAEASKTHLIYNGLPAQRPSGGDIRKELGLKKDTVLMTQVANLIHYKGIEDLIKAAAQLPSELDWRVIFVGNDSHKNRLSYETLVQEQGLQEKIIFLGRREDVTDILDASDIGILASHEEGFSNAVLEGMASSLPMVVTEAGGNPEAIQDGRQGFVVPIKSPDALATALQKLIDDKALRSEMGAAAKQRQEQEFSFEKCVSRYKEFYSTLLK